MRGVSAVVRLSRETSTLIDLHDGVREIFLDAQHVLVERYRAGYSWHFRSREHAPNLERVRVQHLRMTAALARVLVALREGPELARALRLSRVCASTAVYRKHMVSRLSIFADVERGARGRYLLFLTCAGWHVSEVAKGELEWRDTVHGRPS